MRLSVLCQNSAVAVNHIMPPAEHGNNAPAHGIITLSFMKRPRHVFNIKPFFFNISVFSKTE